MNLARFHSALAAILASLATPLAVGAEDLAPHGFRTLPAELKLTGNFARAQLVVQGFEADGQARETSADLTYRVRYESSAPQVATVGETGLVTAVGDGTGSIRIVLGDRTAEVPVTVAGVVAEPRIEFDRDVRPVLSKAGCNAGACHATQYGKGGFKLSVFGFEPQADWQALVRERNGRRVDRLEPEASLFLRKPTLEVAHGGGRRLTAGTLDHQTLVAWVRGGAPGPNAAAAQVTAIEVAPRRRVGAIGQTQQLRVVASYSDGTQRDVTRWAKYDSMDDAVCTVREDGFLTAVGKGQGPILVRFENQAEVATFVVPFSPSVPLAGWQDQNFIDGLAAKKFRELGLEPSGLCDDATFLRRAYLDATGALPTVAVTRQFLASTAPDKRARLVDELLGLSGDPARDIHNDRYAALWTLRWSDLIRNNSNTLGEQGMWALHNWVRESFRANRPFDQFVRELITAKGSIYQSGPANYYRVATAPPDLAETTAQLFLGIRLQCAKCHHHPFEKFSQEDYYGFAAFFARVGTKNSQEFGLFGRESVVLVRSSGEVTHPKTGQRMAPTPLGGQAVDDPLDRRLPLAAWLTGPENRYFARNLANRYADFLLGRALVEPVDDLRATNPASNEDLLQGLAEQIVAQKYDLKQTLRALLNSRLYQLTSQPTAANATDRRFYSHFQVKRLQAEVLLDAVDDVTGSPTKFKNLPAGTRAIELPDAEYPDYFLNTFAKPKRASVCDCERPRDENLAQALHLLNGDLVAAKIAAPQGRVARLIAAQTPSQQIVEELYLAALCRFPTAADQEAAAKLQPDAANPKEFYEDLLWALMNSKQFLFVR